MNQNLSHAKNRLELVIVALPSENDPVRKFSSEKEAHLTLLYLGHTNFDASQISLITEYVEHAASQLSPFMLNVERRGELGDKRADVLFFNKKWSKDIAKFRSQLLQNDLISLAYLSTDQFPEWTPHLTMGYPDTPAKKDTREDPGFWYVNFDRIALWTGDSTGPTFQLDHRDYDMEVAMSQTQRGRSFIMGESLSHYGVKGMRWGVRKSDPGGGTNSSPKTSQPRMSADAKAVDKAFSKIDRGGTDALSNQELQGLVTRLNLEQQYSRLTTSTSPQQVSRLERGHNNVKKYLGMAKTYEDVRKFMQTPTGQKIKTGLFSAAAAGAAYASGGATAAAGAGASVVIRRSQNHYTNVGN